MATTKIWDIKGRLDKALNYATNPVKTENPNFSIAELQSLKDVMDYATNDIKTEKQFYVSGVNCDPDFARDEMVDTKNHWGKVDGILAYHAYQSFAPGEVTPEIAHDIGIKLAKQMWGERFEVLIATHLNSHCLHNHFVINSVSLIDGGKYNDCTDSYHQLRNLSDKICREYGLSVIDSPKSVSKNRVEWQADQDGRQTKRGFVRQDIDKAIEQSTTLKHFWEAMEEMGYEINMSGKYPRVKPNGSPRFFRLYNLGEKYTPEAIKMRILHNVQRKLPVPEAKSKIRTYRYRGDIKTGKKVRGLRALYLYYCYKMKMIKPHPTSNKRMHFLLREDLIRFNKIIAQCNLLVDQKIESLEDLSIYKSSLNEKIQNLTKNRKALKYQLKQLFCVGIEEEQAEVKAKLAGVSAELKKLRTDLRLCDGIYARSTQMNETAKQIRSDEFKQGREMEAYEHIRRSGRPNR